MLTNLIHVSVRSGATDDVSVNESKETADRADLYFTTSLKGEISSDKNANKSISIVLRS